MKKVLLCTSAICTAWCMSATQAQAQEQGDDEARESNIIVVTATKRNVSTQDVPLSITAIGEEALSAGAVADLRSLTELDPSFTALSSQSSASATSLKIRGIGTVGNNPGFEGAVGVFLDGVYQPRPGVALSEFVDIEAVEILRGPQGTLFGKNTTAGALSIRSKAPQIGVTEGFISATAGNYSLWNVKGALNIGVSDTFALRAAGSYRKRDGFYEGVAGTGLPDANDRDRFTVRLSALWEPNDDISLRLTGDISENDESCCALNAVASGGDPAIEAAIGFPVGGPRPGDYLYGHEVGQDASQQQGIIAELDWKLGDSVNLTYIGSYRNYESTSDVDGDFSLFVDSFNPIPNRPFTSDVELTTHELRFQGLAFDSRLDWLVGAYYSDEKVGAGYGYEHGTFVDSALAGLVGAALSIPPVQPIAIANGLDTLPPVEGSFAFNTFAQDAETFALFTHNVLDITDQLSFTVGLRYVNESKTGGLVSSEGQATCSQVFASLSGFNADVAGTPFAGLGTGGLGLASFACNALTAPAAGNPFLSLYQTDFDDDALTWTTSLRYEFNDDVSVYATVSEGFKSGGVNLDPTGSGAIPGNDTFGSESIRNYELGLKSLLADGRIRLNAALFYMDIENYQLQVLQGLGFVVFNVPKAKSKGAEIEVSAELSDDLTVNASAAFTNPRFTSDCAPGSTNAAVLFQCGQPLLDAAKFSGVFGINYTRSVSNDLEVFFRPSVRYAGKQRPSPALTRLADSATFVNLSAGISSDAWSLEFWVNNLTKEIQEGRNLRSTAALLVGAPNPDDYQTSFLSSQPRTFGATARFNF